MLLLLVAAIIIIIICIIVYFIFQKKPVEVEPDLYIAPDGEYTCESGFYRSYKGECLPLAQHGQSCKADNQCATNKCSTMALVCVDEKGKVPLGGKCVVGSNFCPENSYCSGNPATCKPTGGLGATCSSNNACKMGLICGSEKKCAIKVQSAPQLKPVPQPKPQLSTKIPKGKPCIAGQNQCASGLYCGGVPIQCRDKLSGGGSCLTNDQCASGNCKYNAALARSFCMLPYPSGESPDTWYALDAGEHCTPGSGIYGASDVAKQRGVSICSRFPGWEFTGYVSDKFDWGPGHPGGRSERKCSNNWKVPICVKKK